FFGIFPTMQKLCRKATPRRYCWGAYGRCVTVTTSPESFVCGDIQCSRLNVPNVLDAARDDEARLIVVYLNVRPVLIVVDEDKAVVGTRGDHLVAPKVSPIEPAHCEHIAPRLYFRARGEDDDIALAEVWRIRIVGKDNTKGIFRSINGGGHSCLAIPNV